MARRRFCVTVALVVGLATPASALAFGPAPPPGNPDATAQLEACEAAVDRQIEKGVTAGGGPKAGEPGPLNCDHFYQAEDSPAPNHIGNGWPPPPFQN
jgi:hypothetical protein